MLDRLALTIQVAFALASIALAAAVVPQARADAGTWKHNRVGLGDARTAPTYLVYLWPHGSVTYAQGPQGENCYVHGRYGWFSDVSAYSWQGYAIGALRWNDALPGYQWRVPQRGKDGHVTFDGITFVNHSRVPVLVTGWCEGVNLQGSQSD